MIELFKDAFKITNRNIILAIPLVIFVQIFELYSLYSRQHVDSTAKLVLASVTILFMFGVFCAGWFYMVKKAVELSKRTFEAGRLHVSSELFKAIPDGIGKYFLSFAGVYVLFFVMQIILTPLVFLLGVRLIGPMDEASLKSLHAVAGNTAAVASFADSLTPEQIIFFGKWSLLFMLATTVIMYVLMLWIPEIIYKTPDAFTALGKSVVKVFKNFSQTAGIFILLWLTGFVLLFLNTFAVGYPLLYFLMAVVMFYFTVYLVVLIFLYYDKKYYE